MRRKNRRSTPRNTVQLTSDTHGELAQYCVVKGVGIGKKAEEAILFWLKTKKEEDKKIEQLLNPAA